MRPSHLTLLVIALLTTLTASAADTVRIKNLKVLAAIYRGEPGADKYMTDHDVLMCKNGLEVGRAFYFRNSLAASTSNSTSRPTMPSLPTTPAPP
jgi:hypothetical protein